MNKEEAMEALGEIITNAISDNTRTIQQMMTLVAHGLEDADDDLVALCGGMEISVNHATGELQFIVGGRTLN